MRFGAEVQADLQAATADQHTFAGSICASERKAFPFRFRVWGLGVRGLGFKGSALRARGPNLLFCGVYGLRLPPYPDTPISLN